MGLSKDSKINMTSVYKRGENNLITDVSGVKVGHFTLKDQEKNIHTGVTAILPHGGNIFKDKVLAAASASSATRTESVRRYVMIPTVP